MAGGITTFTVAGSQGNEGEEKVVIYSNADDEAVECMKAALDENGYKGQYILQTFGTSELGGKLLAEGENIEADLITMSTFYVDSAQKEQKMFLDLTFEVNTQMMKENNLPMPASLKDLVSEYGEEGAKEVLTESVAVVDKQEKTNEKAMDMARVDMCIIEKGREKLLEYYPNALYAGETTDSANQSANPKVFEEPLTVELLERHQALSESCK